MLVIDGINHVSMSNGLVRIQVVQTGADGKNKGVEEIAIPAAQYGNVVQALQQAGQNLQQQLQQQKQQEGEQRASQQSETEPAQQGDSFQF